MSPPRNLPCAGALWAERPPPPPGGSCFKFQNWGGGALLGVSLRGVFLFLGGGGLNPPPPPAPPLAYSYKLCKGLGRSSRVCATAWAYKISRATYWKKYMCLGGRFPLRVSFIVCSRPEDGLRCRQGVKPPLNQPTKYSSSPDWLSYMIALCSHPEDGLIDADRA